MTTVTRYFKDRVQTISQLKTQGVTVYRKFTITVSLKEFVEKYKPIGNGEQSQQIESLAGRIMRKEKSRNFTIYHMHGGGESVQIKADAKSHVGDVRVMHGDIVGVTGFPGKGKSGEAILHATLVEVLSPCLHQLPSLPEIVTIFSPGNTRDAQMYSLKPEARARNRHLDLILNKDVRVIFETRSKIISLSEEVETPVLNSIPGVGAGDPFVTSYKNMKLFLRVAPETNLKKLLVGGLDRVYEIGKQFRNEGIDSTHNPEFTSCELYTTYADYEDMMMLTEELLSGLVKEMTGSFIIKCWSDNSAKEPIEIDFTPPFRRMDFLEELEKLSELSIPGDLESIEANDYLKNACVRLGVECKPPHRTSRLLDKLIDHFLVPNCLNPTFIINHPKVMSIMAKSHELKPEVTERFELYVNKQELCNAYSELNDPVEQRQRFDELLKELETEEYKATIVDEEYCEALEYGLPPAAGWGMGVDRLVMLLTYSQTIKDVLTFPMMRLQAKKKKSELGGRPLC